MFTWVHILQILFFVDSFFIVNFISALNDKTPPAGRETINQIIAYCKQFRVELSSQQISAMMAVNTPVYLDTVAWFSWFVSLVYF